MKTPSEIVDGALGEKIPVTREGLEAWVAKIQADALNKQLLTDLEEWRAYLRILLGRLTPGGTSLERDALKAWSIADDQLALTLNKAIGGQVADKAGAVCHRCGEKDPCGCEPSSEGKVW